MRQDFDAVHAKFWLSEGRKPCMPGIRPLERKPKPGAGIPIQLADHVIEIGLIPGSNRTRLVQELDLGGEIGNCIGGSPDHGGCRSTDGVVPAEYPAAPIEFVEHQLEFPRGNVAPFAPE